jgi:hypothetical protein
MLTRRMFYFSVSVISDIGWSVQLFPGLTVPQRQTARREESSVKVSQPLDELF